MNVHYARLSGVKTLKTLTARYIGDNCDISAYACIIGDIRMGDNVTIGAMAFVNKNVPARSLVYSEESMIIRTK